MGYEKVYKREGLRVRAYYKEKVDEALKTDKKAQARYLIENEVFDIRDSVADNAKMISLLVSFIERIWSITPDDQKDNLSDEDREAIEYVIGKFKETITWADIQWQQEGIGFADRLLERQGKIGEIIKKVY